MSLNWSLAKIKDKDTVCFIPNRYDPETEKVGRGLNPVTESLIWACVAIELGEITAKNAKEFHARLERWELVIGNYLRNRGPITLAEVEQHIGLHTNVSNRSRAAFEKKLALLAMDQALREGRHREEERKESAEKKEKRDTWRKNHDSRKSVLEDSHADQDQKADQEDSARQEDHRQEAGPEDGGQDQAQRQAEPGIERQPQQLGAEVEQAQEAGQAEGARPGARHRRADGGAARGARGARTR